MRTTLYFLVDDPIKTVDLLQAISAAPLSGDPYQSQRVDGIAYDDHNRPLFWSVGHATKTYGWLKYLWDEDKKPAPHLMKLAFEVLDHKEVQAILEYTRQEEEDGIWTL